MEWGFRKETTPTSIFQNIGKISSFLHLPFRDFLLLISFPVFYASPFTAEISLPVFWLAGFFVCNTSLGPFFGIISLCVFGCFAELEKSNDV